MGDLILLLLGRLDELSNSIELIIGNGLTALPKVSRHSLFERALEKRV